MNHTSWAICSFYSLEHFLKGTIFLTFRLSSLTMKMENQGHNFTFKKEEKLKKLKEIDRLFKEGNSFHIYPLRWVWVSTKESIQTFSPTQVAVSVSKRKFKLAVDRNRVKRLMREAWRLNKHSLHEKINDGEHYSMMLIYTGNKKEPLRYITKRLKKGMDRFIREAQKEIPTK